MPSCGALEGGGQGESDLVVGWGDEHLLVGRGDDDLVVTRGDEGQSDKERPDRRNERLGDDGPGIASGSSDGSFVDFLLGRLVCFVTGGDARTEEKLSSNIASLLMLALSLVRPSKILSSSGRRSSSSCMSYVSCKAKDRGG